MSGENGKTNGDRIDSVPISVKKSRWFLRWPTLVTVVLAVLIFVVPLIVALTVKSNNSANERRRACEVNLLVIDGAVNGFCVEKKRYPKTVDELEGEFLEKIPRCPSGPKPYKLEGPNPPRAICPNDATHRI